MTDFLYPFIDGGERDLGALLRDLGASADSKAAASAQLRIATLDRAANDVAAAAQAMALRLAAGGTLFTFGNGGSSTDAATIAALYAAPPSGVALASRCLVTDTAVITALGNDVGFDLVFSRQLIAHGQPGDVALGLSTSGNSRNLLAAFAEAKRRRLLTVGVAGYDGGDMARSEHVEHCLVVGSDSVHRIQEVQASLMFALWVAVQDHLPPERRHG